MSQIENQVNTLVLGFFSKINANVTEKNGLFDVEIPEKYSKLFRANNLKITFDDKISKPDNYELLSPGSNTLLKILSECIDFGPVITAKLNLNEHNSKIIRFYFYVIFESVKSKTRLVHVDVEVTTQKIVVINNSEINFKGNPSVQEISSEIIDDCYIESMDYLKQSMKSDIENFKNQIFKLKDEELQNVNSEYKKRLNQIQEKSTILRSKSGTDTAFQKIIDETVSIQEEAIKVLKIINDKYHISIDFALISAIIFY